MRPSAICKALRVDKRYVYKVVEHTKKELITLSEKRHDTTKSWKIPNFILTEIQEFWNVHRSKLYRVKEVPSYLKSNYPLSRIPSLSFIARYMKMLLNMSYKKVSWRTLKVLWPETVNLKLSYIRFVEENERLGFKIHKNRLIFHLKITVLILSMDNKGKVWVHSLRRTTIKKIFGHCRD